MRNRKHYNLSEEHSIVVINIIIIILFVTILIIEII